MAKYRKRPVVIEAKQWLGWGWTYNDVALEKVRPYDVYSEEITECKHCGKGQSEHGWVDTLEGGHIVCPTDFIITGIAGEHYPCKADIFKKTYELVKD